MIQKLPNRTPEVPSALANWVPMPRYLLRCHVVKRLIRSLQPADFIEIGAATGHLAEWVNRRLQIGGTAVEISPTAVAMLQERFKVNPEIRIFDRDARELDDDTDLLISMEVLEHIQDDAAALRDWFNLIRPGGHLLLSVPAHPRMFTEEDELAGHFRRYTRQDLIDRLQAAGFEQPRILAYGFPLGLLLKKLRTASARKQLRTDQRTRQQRTEASGVERRRWISFRWLLNDGFLLPFQWLQMPFLRCDLSDGYIAVARKPATGKAGG